MSYEEAAEYFASLQAFGWRLDLSRMEALCDRLGRPERAFKVVHVAGTNGKGSTTAMVAAILAHAGFRVGSYFSPYVFNLRERVMLAQPGEPPLMIPEADFARILTELRPHIEAVAADESVGQPTEFEVKTMLALLYFREQGADWAVLETGLGGRLDATNVCRPEACVITNIGLDHTERLGDTLEAIAGEKAGIIKRGAAVLTGAEEPALSVIRAAYEERGGAEWGRVWQGSGGVPLAEQCINGSAARWRSAIDALPGPSYQRMNAALAEITAEALRHRGLRLPDAAIERGVRCASLPGRFQVVRNDPHVILDGAHNREAAAALASSLSTAFGERKKILVIGMMGRHAVDGVMAELAPLAASIIATEPTNERRLPAERVAEEAARHGLDAPVVRPPMEALRRALELASPEDVVVVTGSFYTVGEIDVAALEAA
ncbi:MAG TPA: folylpolyglutamate synthase/dihydrofolate synthase family protein [Armatimonadota bacterium]